MSETENICENICESTTEGKEKILVIDGYVQAQERPRFARRGRGVMTYDPERSKNYKRVVKYEAMKVFKKPFESPIRVEIHVFRNPPKSWSKKKKAEALNGDIKPETRPDLDNYVKSILDGLDGVAFKDDNIVCELIAKKSYGKERAEIKIVKLK